VKTNDKTLLTILLIVLCMNFNGGIYNDTKNNIVVRIIVSLRRNETEPRSLTKFKLKAGFTGDRKPERIWIAFITTINNIESDNTEE